jgi:hypothetical protein
MSNANIERVAGRVILLGDHIKVSKEGLRMPSIQILHQESDNSGKSSFITGHNYAQVSAVITNGTVSRSLPLKTQMQISPQRKEGTNAPDGDTLVTQMVNLVYDVAKRIGKPVFVALDAYFSSCAAWVAADKTIMSNGEKMVEIITRAQSNTVAYNIPEPPTVKKRGQPRKYGDKIVLNSLFSDKSKFTPTTMTLYGKRVKVSYLCLDLIWRPVKRLVRFVAVEMDGKRCILMSTSLTIDPEDIITIYAMRFKIETGFAEQKNEIGSFAYHFWTTALVKRKKWKRIPRLSDKTLQTKIDNTEKAMDSFVCLCTIATGILSIIAFSHSREIWEHYPGWIRTRRSEVPTVATVKLVVAQVFPLLLKTDSLLFLGEIFCSRCRDSEFIYKNVS